MPTRSAHRRPLAVLSVLTLSALVLSGCAGKDEQGEDYTPPAGGGATAVPTQVDGAPKGAPAPAPTASTPTTASPAPSSPAPSASSTPSIDDSAWRDIPATAEPEVPETSEDERRTRGTPPWVATQVVLGLYTSDYSETRYGGNRLGLRPHVTDKFWAYIGGPALSADPTGTQDPAWAQEKAAKRSTEVKIERAQANANGRAGGDEIVDVEYSTVTKEAGQIVSTREGAVSYLMVKQGGVWKVDQIVQ